jgi:hypothetical protein
MKKLLVGAVVVFICLVAVVAGALYLYAHNSKKDKLVAVKNEVKKTIDKVSVLMVLPKGEDPTVATVADITKLSAQPFFEKAQNGDKVLIYAKAGVAILYRPSVNKIVTVAPVKTVADNTAVTPSAPIVTIAKASVTPVPTNIPKTTVTLVPTKVLVPTNTPKPTVTPNLPKLKVVLYNGTTKAGITFTVEWSLTRQFPDVTVVDKQPAANTDYDKTLVVDITGKNSSKVRDLAAALSGEVSKMPSGEAKPKADILIILGKDKVQ